MVLALPDEFFEGWEWNDGDLFLYIPDVENALPEGYYIFPVSNGVLCFSGWREDISSWIKVEDVTLDEGRPLPSQEQLQKMVGLSPNEFIEDVSDYICEPVKEDEDLSIFHIDMNCFTLAYVMDRKYGKYWNGDAWI